MASKKKNAAAKAPKSAPVSAAELVELEQEINEHRASLADAIGRYNFALDAAKATA